MRCRPWLSSAYSNQSNTPQKWRHFCSQWRAKAESEDPKPRGVLSRPHLQQHVKGQEGGKKGNLTLFSYLRLSLWFCELVKPESSLCGYQPAKPHMCLLPCHTCMIGCVGWMCPVSWALGDSPTESGCLCQLRISLLTLVMCDSLSICLSEKNKMREVGGWCMDVWHWSRRGLCELDVWHCVAARAHSFAIGISVEMPEHVK